MRLAKETLAAILGFLAQTRNISLLGDYRCLRLPPEQRIAPGRFPRGDRATNPTQGFVFPGRRSGRRVARMNSQSSDNRAEAIGLGAF